MKINIHRQENIAIIDLLGEIDANTAPIVKNQILPLIQEGKKLLLNMTQVPYMSSAGLRMLLSLYRQSMDKNAQLVLIGLVEEIQDTMSVTGFLNFFTTCETLEDGFALVN